MFYKGKVCNPFGWTTVTVALINGSTVAVSWGSVPGEDVFMQWTDPNPIAVRYFAVRSGWGTDARWRIDKVVEEEGMEY